MILFLEIIGRTRSLLRRAGLLILLGLILVVGGWQFAAADHRTFGTALYWAVTTATTVGYGDVTPSTWAGRLIAMGLMLTAIPILGIVFANVTSSLSEVRMRRLLGMGRVRRMTGHMLVLGWNPRARIAVEELLHLGFQVVLLANEASNPLEHDRLQFIHGDPTDEAALARLAPEQARGALVCLPDDGATLIASIALLHLAPGLTVAAQTDGERTRAALRDLGIGATVSVDSLVGHALAKSVESPHAGELLLRLVDTEHCRIIEYPVSPEDRGQSVDEVRQRAGSPLILGVVHEGAVRLGVSEPVHLADGDRLLVLAAAKPADGRD